jgi:serine/threonine-protein phosphatase 2A regulatory subunit A
MTTLDPLKLLQEDSKDDDYEQCIASIKRLTTIALALGPQRTRNELLPFLMEYSDQDNDEALAAIGAQLGDFVDLVGGEQHAVVLLPLLEKLAGEEESVVRDEAQQSLQRLVTKLPKSEVGAKFIPVVRRLANGDWFTTRVSACGLFSCSYHLVSESLQDELRSLFTNLCNDDTPMVRKAAFAQLGEFVTTVQKQHFKTDMLPVLKALAQDDLDYMRIYTIDCCKQLAAKAEPGDFVAHVLPLVDGIQDDASWRVRKQLAVSLPELCRDVGDQTASKRLLPIFVKLLKDKEAEVRAAAAEALGDLVGHITSTSDLVEQVSPCLEALAADPVQIVRVAFSKTVVLLCNAFGWARASCRRCSSSRKTPSGGCAWRWWTSALCWRSTLASRTSKSVCNRSSSWR